MKQLMLLWTIIISSIASFGQAPLQLNFQGAARNAQGNVIVNKNISVRLSVLSSSAPQVTDYSETRSVTTSMVGLFNVVIGSAGATATWGSMAAVNWGLGNKYLLLEIDPEGGNNFINLGTTQLQSVPFALNANTAAPVGIAGGDLAGNYPTPAIGDNKITTAKIAANAVTDSKIVSVSGIKVTGNIAGSAGNVTGIVSVSNGGTGAGNTSDARINLGLGNVDNTSDADKPVSLATGLALNKKLNIADTAAMFAPHISGVIARLNLKFNVADTAALLSPYAERINSKVSITDTAAMLAPYATNSGTTAGLNLKVNIADTATMLAPYATNAGTTTGLNLKVNIADTASMLNTYAAGINSKVNIADTSAMLAPYATNFGTNAELNLKLNISDTAAMLAAYAAGVNLKVNITDTATMLAPYATNSGTAAGLNLKVNISDTALMLNTYAAGINSKVNIADTSAMLAPYATNFGTNAELNLKLNISDTAAMLAAYAAGVNLKVNITDTATMLAPYATNSGTAVGLNLKVNIADTAAMLAPYATNSGTTAALNLKVNVADTGAMLAPYATNSGTAVGLNLKVNIADTAAMLAPYATNSGTTAGLNFKVNIADTAAMLAPYASNSGTSAGLNLKVNIADTAAMLAPYATNSGTAVGLNLKVNIADTAAMLSPYATNSGTSAGLNLKVNIADTAAMLNAYASGINSKVNIADTSAMLAPYATNSGTTAGLNLKVNISDTASMLNAYATGINSKVNIADTATMLAPYATNSGTTAGLNLKVNIADTAAMLAPYASNSGTTAGLNLKVNISDTASMLNAYATGINSKVNIADTATMLSPYATNSGTTAGLNLKVNISDTASMLNAYAAGINSKVNIADTAAMLAPYATNSGTTAGLNLKVNIADTAAMLNAYAAGINSKVNIADTATMLAPYATNVGTIAGLNLKVNISDTASMLNAYAAGINSKVNIADTAAMLAPYATNSGTTAGLNLKVNISDTASMLNAYAAGINSKVNIADTAAMLAPYATNSGTIAGLNLKVNIADTAAMLAPYATNSGTNAALNLKINISDTALMLNAYAAGINSKLNISDTAAMLAPYALTVGGEKIRGVSNDSTTTYGDSTQLITEMAAKAYARTVSKTKFGTDDVLADGDRTFNGNEGVYNFEISKVKGLTLEANEVHLKSGHNHIRLQNDSLQLLLKKGQLAIDSLQSTSSMLNKQIMVRDSVGDGVYGITPAALGIVSGSGALNFAPRWNAGGKALVNSQIFDNGTKIGIGTTTPASLFSVRGDIITNGGIDLFNTSTVATPFPVFQYSGAPYRAGEFVPKLTISYNNALAQNLPDINGNYTTFFGLNQHEMNGDTLHGVVGLSMEGYYRLGGQAVQELHLIHNFKKSVGGGTRFLTFAGREDGGYEGLDLASDVIALNGRSNQPKWVLDSRNNQIDIKDSVTTLYRTIGLPVQLQSVNGSSSAPLGYYDSTGRHMILNNLDVYQDGTPSAVVASYYQGLKLSGGGTTFLSIPPMGTMEIKNNAATSITEEILRLSNGNTGGSADSTWKLLVGSGNQFSSGDFIIGSAPNVTASNYSLLLSSGGGAKARLNVTSPVFSSPIAGVGDASISSWTNTGGNFNGYYAAGAKHGNKGTNGSDFRAYIGTSAASNLSVRDGNENVLMQVNSNGNVGIGTTTPTAKLEVVGSLKVNNGNLNVDQFQVNPPSVFTPVTASIVPAPTTQWVIINPPHTLAVLTITLPNNPVDGQLVEYSFRETILLLNVTAGTGGAAVDTETSVLAKTCIKWGYSAGLKRWVIR